MMGNNLKNTTSLIQSKTMPVSLYLKGLYSLIVVVHKSNNNKQV